MSWILIMSYQSSITKYLLFFTLLLLAFFIFNQSYDKNLISFTVKEDVRDILREVVEQAQLTKQQKTKFLYDNWFLEPAASPYNLSRQFQSQKYFSQDKQDEFVDKYFQKLKNGIFLEVGAADGVTFPNTLFLKRERNWTGVLIEANRKLYHSLVTLKRKVYIINVCLSLDDGINVVSFLPAELLGGVEKPLTAEKMMDRVKHDYPDIKAEEVLCIPLYSILKAISMTHINFFSLDVKGAELAILRTIPFYLVTIDLFMIEYYVPSGAAETQKRLKEFRDFFNQRRIYKEVYLGAGDVAFARQWTEEYKCLFVNVFPFAWVSLMVF